MLVLIGADWGRCRRGGNARMRPPRPTFIWRQLTIMVHLGLIFWWTWWSLDGVRVCLLLCTQDNWMHVGSNGKPVNNRCSAVPVPSGRIALVHSYKFHNNVVLLGSQAERKSSLMSILLWCQDPNRAWKVKNKTKKNAICYKKPQHANFRGTPPFF